MIQMVWSALAEKKKNDYNVSLRPVDAVQSRMKMEPEKNCTAKLIYPNWNGTVRFLAVSTYALGPVFQEEGMGCWQLKFVYLYIN